MRQGPGGSRRGVRNRRGRLGTLAKVPSAVCMEPVGACTPMLGNLKVQAETGQGLGFHGLQGWRAQSCRPQLLAPLPPDGLLEEPVWEAEEAYRSKRGTLPAPRKGCCRGRKPPSLEAQRVSWTEGSRCSSLQVREPKILKAERARRCRRP